jgi:hypothetical protein
MALGASRMFVLARLFILAVPPRGERERGRLCALRKERAPLFPNVACVGVPVVGE